MPTDEPTVHVPDGVILCRTRGGREITVVEAIRNPEIAEQVDPSTFTRRGLRLLERTRRKAIALQRKSNG